MNEVAEEETGDVAMVPRVTVGVPTPARAVVDEIVEGDVAEEKQELNQKAVAEEDDEALEEEQTILDGELQIQRYRPLHPFHRLQVSLEGAAPSRA
jgi:hypothetical protein